MKKPYALLQAKVLDLVRDDKFAHLALEYQYNGARRLGLFWAFNDNVSEDVKPDTRINAVHNYESGQVFGIKIY